ncbi:MAG: hypothetical protein GXO88_13645 [Chlorobi bacterium]|nr:hypothetical protein [Chlorobiota bacterium]
MDTNAFKPKEPFNSTVGTSFNIGWDLINSKFGNLLLITLLGVAFQIIVQYFIRGSDYGLHGNSVSYGLIGILFSVLIVMPYFFGINYVNLQLVIGEAFNIADAFKGFDYIYLNVMLAGMFRIVIIGIGLVLLIVPGIIFACRLSFVPYLVIDKQLTAIDAIKTSWAMTNGHAITIFMMFLLSIPIVILGLLALLVGIIPASMWINAAFASFYHSVDIGYNKEIIPGDA